MPTTYLESFCADLSENKLFQCVSILLTGMSTLWTLKTASPYHNNIKTVHKNFPTSS